MTDYGCQFCGGAHHWTLCPHRGWRDYETGKFHTIALHRRVGHWLGYRLPVLGRLLDERDRALAELARQKDDINHARKNNPLFYPRGSAQDQARVLRLFSLFSPVELLDAPMTRIGRRADGGYVMADDFANTRAAFSFGIEYECSWDRAIAARGIPVYQYDGSVDSPPHDHELFVFHKEMIGSGGGYTPLADVIARHAAPLDKNILKMDIETHEWETFDAADPLDLARFSQIVCEFHGFHNLDDSQWYACALRVMTKLRSHFEIVHVHANNAAHIDMFASVAFPAVLEVTFVAKHGHRFGPCTKTFPTPLDAPNDINAADIFLGTFQFEEPKQ